MNDKELVIVQAKYPDDFEKAVNSYLEQGGWRVAETEMSVTDHHYFAMLIQSERKKDGE